MMLMRAAAGRVFFVCVVREAWSGGIGLHSHTWCCCRRCCRGFAWSDQRCGGSSGFCPSCMAMASKGGQVGLLQA